MSMSISGIVLNKVKLFRYVLPLSGQCNTPSGHNQSFLSSSFTQLEYHRVRLVIVTPGWLRGVIVTMVGIVPECHGLASSTVRNYLPFWTSHFVNVSCLLHTESASYRPRLGNVLLENSAY